MQPENNNQTEKMCIVAMCEVCNEPMIFDGTDTQFMIENDYIECDYCKQLNPITDELKDAMIDIL